MRAILIALGNAARAVLRWVRLVHDEGDAHPINRALESFAARFVLVLACAVALVGLERAGYTDLLAWTDRLFPSSRYPWLFGGFTLLYLGLHLAGDRNRKPLLLVASLAALVYFDPRFAAVSVAFFAAYYAVAFSGLPTAVKLAFVCATYAAMMAVSSWVAFPELLLARPWVAGLTYAFAVNYTFRIFYFFHEARMRKWKRVPPIDFALYFLFAPYFVIVPYMFAIPRYGNFTRGLAKRDPAREASGVRHLLAGVIMIVVYHYLAQLYDPRPDLIGYLRVHDWPRAIAVGVLYYPVDAVLGVLGVAYTLTGMLQVLGADVTPAFQRALTATSIHEWWRRWNVHFRDFLVDIFFYPLMIKWRKRNPYLTIVVGCASVFLIGSTVFHWIGKHWFEVGSHVSVYWSIVVENALMFAFVAAGLCLEKRRILQHRPPHPPPHLVDTGRPLWAWLGYQLGRGGKLAATWVLLVTVVVFAGYGATYAEYYRPVEATDHDFGIALAALDDGDRVGAGALVSDHVPVLREQVRALPREPVRRLRLALAYSLPGPWYAPMAARRELAIARLTADPTDPEQARLLAQLW